MRSRLRTARIYYTEGNVKASVLMVTVSTIQQRGLTGGPFSLGISLYKHVYDPLSGVSGVAATMSDYRVGQHTGDVTFILAMLARQMDEFIDAYLRVNEPAC